MQNIWRKTLSPCVCTGRSIENVFTLRDVWSKWTKQLTILFIWDDDPIASDLFNRRINSRTGTWSTWRIFGVNKPQKTMHVYWRSSLFSISLATHHQNHYFFRIICQIWYIFITFEWKLHSITLSFDENWICYQWYWHIYWYALLKSAFFLFKTLLNFNYVSKYT